MYCSSPQPLLPIAAPGQPARAGARVRTHGSRLRPRSPFLATGSAAVSCTLLALLRDLLPLERGDPERLWPLLSAAGGRVATFVNCKQTHVVLQQSRPCLLLVAFTQRFLLPPASLGFLPFPCFLALSGNPLLRRFFGESGACEWTATMLPSRGSRLGGGGEPGGVNVCREQGCSSVGGVLARGCEAYVDPWWPCFEQGNRSPPHVGSR